MKSLKCNGTKVHEEIVKKYSNSLIAEQTCHDLSGLFKMFADASRIRILDCLFQHEMCVCDLSTLLEMSQSAVSHQLALLRNARLIKYRRSGKNIYYSLDDEHIQLIYDAGMSHVIESRGV